MRIGRKAAAAAIGAVGVLAAPVAAFAQAGPGSVLDNRPVGSPPPCSADACTWERTLGGSAEDKAYAVVAMPDDGLVVAGNSLSFGNTRYDAWIARLDRAGETLWTLRLGGPEADHIYALAPTADGGVLAAGDTRSAGEGESDAWLVRLDDAGEIEWQRVMGGVSNDRARTALALPDGGFVVGGFTGIGLGDRDIWIARLTGDGVPLWQREFGGPGDDGAFHLAAAPDGGLFVTGYWQTGEGRGFDLWAARLDGSGQPVWQRRFHSGNFDAGTGMVPQADGGVIVTGMTQTGGPEQLDIWVLKLDENGEPAWERRLGGERTDGAWAAIARPGGGLVISAATASQGAGSTDAWMMALDGDGDVAWERVIGGALWDRPTALAAAAQGGELLVAGYTTTMGAGFEDFWLLRLDGEGRR